MAPNPASAPFHRSVSPLSFSPIAIPASAAISISECSDLDLDSDGAGSFRPSKRRRIEEIGKRYLEGKPLYILSAGIRGPFGNGWENPWGKKEKARNRNEREIPETDSRAVDGRIELGLEHRAEKKKRKSKSKSRSKDVETRDGNEKEINGKARKKKRKIDKKIEQQKTQALPTESSHTLRAEASREDTSGKQSQKKSPTPQRGSTPSNIPDATKVDRWLKNERIREWTKSISTQPTPLPSPTPHSSSRPKYANKIHYLNPPRLIAEGVETEQDESGRSPNERDRETSETRGHYGGGGVAAEDGLEPEAPSAMAFLNSISQGKSGSESNSSHLDKSTKVSPVNREQSKDSTPGQQNYETAPESPSERVETRRNRKSLHMVPSSGHLPAFEYRRAGRRSGSARASAQLEEAGEKPGVDKVVGHEPEDQQSEREDQSQKTNHKAPAAEDDVIMLDEESMMEEEANAQVQDATASLKEDAAKSDIIEMAQSGVTEDFEAQNGVRTEVQVPVEEQLGSHVGSTVQDNQVSATTSTMPSAQVVSHHDTILVAHSNPSTDVLKSYKQQSVIEEQSPAREEGTIVEDSVPMNTQAAIMQADRLFRAAIESPDIRRLSQPTIRRSVDRDSIDIAGFPAPASRRGSFNSPGSIKPFSKFNTPSPQKPKIARPGPRLSLEQQSTQAMLDGISPFAISTVKRVQPMAETMSRALNLKPRARFEDTSVETSGEIVSEPGSAIPARRFGEEVPDMDTSQSSDEGSPTVLRGQPTSDSEARKGAKSRSSQSITSLTTASDKNPAAQASADSAADLVFSIPNLSSTSNAGQHGQGAQGIIFTSGIHTDGLNTYASTYKARSFTAINATTRHSPRASQEQTDNHEPLTERQNFNDTSSQSLSQIQRFTREGSSFDLAEALNEATSFLKSADLEVDLKEIARSREMESSFQSYSN